MNFIAKLTLSQCVSLGMFFIAVLAPGYLLLATFKADWLVKYEGVKLMVIALAVASPLVFAAALVADLIVEFPSQRYLLHLVIMTATIMVACYYPAIALTNMYRLNFWQFAGVMVAASMVGYLPAKMGYKRIQAL